MRNKPALPEAQPSIYALIDDETLAQVGRMADKYGVSREELIVELIRLDLADRTASTGCTNSRWVSEADTDPEIGCHSYEARHPSGPAAREVCLQPGDQPFDERLRDLVRLVA